MATTTRTALQTAERRLNLGPDTDTVQRRLGKLRRLRANLEAEYAVHPSTVNAVCLATVYSELSATILRTHLPAIHDEEEAA